MADAAAAMAFTLVDGRGVLTIAARDLGPLLVERLEVEWPGARDVRAATELRNRRGRLCGATLILDGAQVAERVAAARIPGRGAGTLGAALEPGRIVLSEPGGGDGPPAVAARLSLGPGPGRTLRVDIDGEPGLRAEIRTALATLFGQAAERDAGYDVDPLAGALDEIFVADGFRLPDSGDLRLDAVRISQNRIALRWAPAGAAGAADLGPDDEDELTALRRALDGAPPGRERAEIAHLLAGAYERAGDEEGALGALRTCIDNAEAGPLVGLAWRRLVELCARRGDPHGAARALIASTDDPRVGASDDERAGALVAAAGILRKRLDLPADAAMLLERAVTLDPTSAAALEALEALSADTGNFARLAEVLEREVEVVARGPREQKSMLSRLADIYERRVANPELARRTYERLLALDPANEAARAGLARHAPPPPPAPRRRTLPPVSAAPTVEAPAVVAVDGESPSQKYWRAAAGESESATRANSRVATARVSLSRGEIPAAVGELEEALGTAPNHPAALALLAEIHYRKQDWHRARELYAALDAVPGAGEALSREQLVWRRATLAQRLGDTADAETLFRELAILNPRHVDARRALAELALARGDTGTAASRLEELLRLLPAGSAAELTDLRHRLGAIYAETGEWNGARYYLELVTSRDPGRIPALELLLQTYQKLGLFQEAAETCGRLARLYADPTHRAAVLYRQAELRRTELDDPAGALDAYLRSSDADPRFVPPRLRLIEHFWDEADLDVVADLANDLANVPLSVEGDADLVVRLAIAAAGPRSATPPRFPLSANPGLLGAAARVLGLAGDRAAARGVDTLDPILTRARFWAGADGERALIEALVELVLADPARPGPAIVLGGLAARTRRFALARAAYALPAFVEPEGLGQRLLDLLPAIDPVRAEAVRVGSPVEHPDVAGPARQALSRLAPALLGLEVDQPAPKPVEGSGLPPARAIELRRIAELLKAPPFVVAPDAEGSGRSPTSPSERRRLRLIPTQPAGLLISPSAAGLGPQAWSFVAGRAIEALRSGLVTAGLTSAEGLARLLEGARAALGGAPVEEPRARAVTEWLRRPEAGVLLGSPEARAELLAQVEAALAGLPDWPTFRRGTRHTCNRIGLLVCASPVDALAVVSEGELRGDDDEPPTAAARAEFLRGASAREMVTFLFSPAYETAIAP